MAIRRSLIDVIDRGMDPKVAHKKLDKQGKLLVHQEGQAPVLANETKLNVLVDDKKNVLTEDKDTLPVEKPADNKDDQKPATKPAEVAKPAVDPKKTDKSPKPV